jgi:hypothetical protein
MTRWWKPTPSAVWTKSRTGGVTVKDSLGNCTPTFIGASTPDERDASLSSPGGELSISVGSMQSSIRVMLGPRR